MKIKVYICCIIFFCLASHGAEFDLGIYGTLSATVPDDWSFKKVNGKSVDTPDGTPRGYTFALKPLSDANAKCLLLFDSPQKAVPDRELIRKDVLRISEVFVSKSVEQKKNLRDFSLEKGYGVYCLFTDASLTGKQVKPGEYKVFGVGKVQPGEGVLGLVTLFADEADGKEFKAMVKIINSLKVQPIDGK